MIEDRSPLSVTTPEPEHVVRYGDHDDAIADVWSGGADAGQRPLVVFLHGGFWRPEYDRKHARGACATIAGHGFTTAAAEYRREPGRPDLMIDDVTLAVARLPELVSGHDDRVVVVGHSAGGHLALLAGSGSIAGADAVVALAPVADLALAHELVLGRGAVAAFLGTGADERADLDPTRLPHPTIPVTVVHGGEDEIVPISIAESYVAAHPATVLIDLPEAGHFTMVVPSDPGFAAVLGAIRDAADASSPGGR